MAITDLLLGILELVLPSRDRQLRRYERLGGLLGLAVFAVGVSAIAIGYWLGFQTPA